LKGKRNECSPPKEGKVRKRGTLKEGRKKRQRKRAEKRFRRASPIYPYPRKRKKKGGERGTEEKRDASTTISSSFTLSASSAGGGRRGEHTASINIRLRRLCRIASREGRKKKKKEDASGSPFLLCVEKEKRRGGWMWLDGAVLFFSFLGKKKKGETARRRSPGRSRFLSGENGEGRKKKGPSSFRCTTLPERRKGGGERGTTGAVNLFFPKGRESGRVQHLPFFPYLSPQEKKGRKKNQPLPCRTARSSFFPH